MSWLRTLSGLVSNSRDRQTKRTKSTMASGLLVRGKKRPDGVILERKSRLQRGTVMQLETLEERVLLSIVPSAPAINPSDGPYDGVQSLGSLRTIAETTSGNFRVVWNDTLAGGVYTQLFQQLPNNTTPTLTPATLVGNTTSADSQETVSCDGAGDSVVAWTHTSTDGSTQVEAQVFGPDGNPGVSGVVSPSGSWYLPTVSVTDATDFLIAYQSNSGGTPVVQVTRVSSAGGSGFETVAGLSINNAAAPSLAVNSLGIGVVAYTDTGTVFPGLYAQKLFTESGAADGAPMSDHMEPAHLIYQPSAGIDAAGNVEIAYTILEKATFVYNALGSSYLYQTDVHIVRFGADGSSSGMHVTNSTSSTNSGYDPSLTMDPAGNFMVACAVGSAANMPSLANESAAAVLAVAYDSTGTFLQTLGDDATSEFLVTPGTLGIADYQPSVAVNANDRLVADFVGSSPGDSSGLNELPENQASIYVQPFVAGRLPLPAPGQPHHQPVHRRSLVAGVAGRHPRSGFHGGADQSDVPDAAPRDWPPALSRSPPPGARSSDSRSP